MWTVSILTLKISNIGLSVVNAVLTAGMFQGMLIRKLGCVMAASKNGWHTKLVLIT